ncbi:MAG: GMC family oxidoreductase, partial [Mesorhizobium sp.]
GGELRVERQRLSWPILDAVREAAEELGVPKVDDFNAGDNFGSSYFEVNQKAGFRFNAVRAFIRPIRNRRNLTILAQAHAERIVLSGRL